MAKGRPSEPSTAALRRDGRTRRILEALEEQGWRVEAARRHLLCYPPDRAKEIVAQSCTPRRGSHAVDNWIAQLRRSGFVWSG